MTAISWTPERFHSLAEFWPTRLVLESVALNVYGELAERPLAAPELADRLGLEMRAATLFFDALAALELLHKKGERYVNCAAAKRYLVPGSADYVGHELIAAQDAWDVWGRLPAALRSGERQREDRVFEDDPEAARHLLLAIHRRAEPRAREMLDRGWLDLKARRRMLDLGGGVGTYSIVFCRAFPSLHCTLVDRPTAAALARAEISAADLEDRIEVVEGDFKAVELPPSFDVVWVSNVIHSRDATANLDLFRRVYGLLDPGGGGEVIVHDFVMEEDRTRPAPGAVFSLHMLLNNGVGRSYTFGEIKGWLDAAGFKEVERIGDHRDIHSLVTGKR